MARPLSFKVTTAGTYLPINRKDVSFVTLDGIVVYLGQGCYLAKDKSQIIYLVFGSPEEPLMIPEGTTVGVHFAEGPGEEVDFVEEELVTDNRPNNIDRQSLEALERLLDGEEDGQSNIDP